MGQLYFGDNLEVLREHVKDESVDLVYLDPPFNSKAAYNLLYKSPVGGDAQIRAFDDTWKWDTAAEEALADLSRDEHATFRVLQALQSFLGYSDLMAYLAMMGVRLVELRRVLKPSGTLYLHCDPTACHYLKVLLDAIFGAEGFVNQVTWKRSHAHSDAAQGAKHYGRVSDNLLVYARSNDRTWNVQYTDYSEEYKQRDYRHVDEDGRRYRLDNIQGPGGAAKGNPLYTVMGVERYWRFSKKRMKELIDAGLIVQTRPGAVPQMKRYLDEMPGVPVQEIWTDIPIINNRSKEMLGFPTQKPLALLERIINVSSNAGDLVLDPFCGCGTAIHAAEKLNRTWVGIDVAYPAIQVIEDRLKTWLPRAKYKVSGIPRDEYSARKLAASNPMTFQQWAVGRLGGRPRGAGGDGGIDGEIIYQKGQRDYGRALVSVKAGRHVNPDMVRSLRGVVERESADMGFFVCLEKPTKGMRDEAMSAHLVEVPGGKRPRIQIVTVSDLVPTCTVGIPTTLNMLQAVEASKQIARQTTKRRRTKDLQKEPPLPPMPIAGGKAEKKEKLSKKRAVAETVRTKRHVSKRKG